MIFQSENNKKAKLPSMLRPGVKGKKKGKGKRRS
jgi:hypothetical protein